MSIFIFIIIFSILMAFIPRNALCNEIITIEPHDTNEPLENPYMGWVLHYYDNVPAHYGSRLEPSDTVDDYPGLTVIYLRIPWSYIEPQEGQFNWSVLDTPAQRWVTKGKQIALRLSCSESWMRYATPEWVQKAGAKGYNFRPGDGVVEDGPYWEPDYNDTIFLDKLDNFLKAVAERYDGNPEVAFIDVGSFGVWGEGHTGASTRLKYSAETLKKHIDIHLKHFRNTLIAANDDFSSQDNAVIDYALEKGLTLRDDSILVQAKERAYFHANMAQDFWPNLPVILESEHYGGSKARGCWEDGHLYLKAVEEYHASYASIHWWPREFLNENEELVQQINMRLGYRIQLLKALWPAKIKDREPFKFSAQWRNAGVAPCYNGGYPAVTFKDSKGGIVGLFVDQDFNISFLPVGPRDQTESKAQSKSFLLPFQLNPGQYDVYISVGNITGTPKIALPLPNNDGERRYKLGVINITGDYAVKVGEIGDKSFLPVKWIIHHQLPPGVTPFCHFEHNNEIKFFGYPVESAKGKFQMEGEVNLGFAFNIPEEVKGKKYHVKIGLWIPERAGQNNERMKPDKGDPDRRINTGTLEVLPSGKTKFNKKL
ncbi:DUF4832 domain-containing protein [Candidatus Poribacteria bacterium]|nr:DUF4832 domain-containing protein [Candidatus Poribacteria bacterium]